MKVTHILFYVFGIFLFFFCLWDFSQSSSLLLSKESPRVSGSRIEPGTYLVTPHLVKRKKTHNLIFCIYFLPLNLLCHTLETNRKIFSTVGPCGQWQRRSACHWKLFQVKSCFHFSYLILHKETTTVRIMSSLQCLKSFTTNTTSKI